MAKPRRQHIFFMIYSLLTYDIYVLRKSRSGMIFACRRFFFFLLLRILEKLSIDLLHSLGTADKILAELNDTHSCERDDMLSMAIHRDKVVTIPTSHGPRTGTLDSLKVTKDYRIQAVIRTTDGAFKSGIVGHQSDTVGAQWFEGIIVH